MAPTQNPDTLEVNLVGPGDRLERTERRQAQRARAGGRVARGLSPGRALLTCQAPRHGSSQKQQQQQLRRQRQRRGRRRGQPEGTPVQAVAGHRSAAATSARLD